MDPRPNDGTITVPLLRKTSRTRIVDRLSRAVVLIGFAAAVRARPRPPRGLPSRLPQHRLAFAGVHEGPVRFGLETEV